MGYSVRGCLRWLAVSQEDGRTLQHNPQRTYIPSEGRCSQTGGPTGPFWQITGAWLGLHWASCLGHAHRVVRASRAGQATCHEELQSLIEAFFNRASSCCRVSVSASACTTALPGSVETPVTRPTGWTGCAR